MKRMASAMDSILRALPRSAKAMLPELYVSQTDILEISLVILSFVLFIFLIIHISKRITQPPFKMLEDTICRPTRMDHLRLSSLHRKYGYNYTRAIKLCSHIEDGIVLGVSLAIAISAILTVSGLVYGIKPFAAIMCNTLVLSRRTIATVVDAFMTLKTWSTLLKTKTSVPHGATTIGENRRNAASTTAMLSLTRRQVYQQEAIPFYRPSCTPNDSEIDSEDSEDDTTVFAVDEDHETHG